MKKITKILAVGFVALLALAVMGCSNPSSGGSGYINPTEVIDGVTNAKTECTFEVTKSDLAGNNFSGLMCTHLLEQVQVEQQRNMKKSQ